MSSLLEKRKFDGFKECHEFLRKAKEQKSKHHYYRIQFLIVYHQLLKDSGTKDETNGPIYQHLLTLWEKDNDLFGKRIYRSFEDKPDVTKFKKNYQYIAVSGQSVVASDIYGGIRDKSIIHFTVTDEKPTKRVEPIMSNNGILRKYLLLTAKTTLHKRKLKVDTYDEILEEDYEVNLKFRTKGYERPDLVFITINPSNKREHWILHSFIHIYCLGLTWDWNQEKMLWIGNKKNPSKDCPIAMLPREIVRHIIKYCRSPL